MTITIDTTGYGYDSFGSVTTFSEVLELITNFGSGDRILSASSTQVVLEVFSPYSSSLMQY